MKMFISLFILFTIHCSLFTASAQSWQELINKTKFLEDKKDYEQALEFAKKALTQAEVEFGINDTIYTNNLNLLYSLYYNNGNYDSALYYCKKELQINKQFSKTGNLNLISNLSWLGEIYYDMGVLDSAIAAYKESLILQREIIKTDDEELAKSINNLAFVNTRNGNFIEAEPLLIESLEMRRRIYKGDSPSIAGSIINLAQFYSDLGRFSEAEPLNEEALAMNRRLFKSDNPYLATSINNMASNYKARSRYSDAEPLYKEALEMNRRLFKGDNQDIAMSLNNLAGFYNIMGRYSEAEQLFIESLDMSRRLFKDGHPYLAKCINNLAYFYDGRGRFIPAEMLYKESLEMKRRLYKEAHPDLIVSLNNLARFYMDRGRYDDAEPLSIEALKMSRQIYKNDHPNLATCISSMASISHKKDNYDEAEKLYNEALGMRRRLYKGNNADLAKSIKYLASLYNDKGLYLKADKLFIESLNMLDDIVQNNFPTLSEKEKEQFWATVKDEFESFTSYSIKRINDNPYILCNLYDYQLNTKALLFNSINKIKRRIVNSGDSELIKLYKDLISHKEYLIQLYSYTKDMLAKGKVNLDSVRNVTNELEKRISAKSEAFAESYEKKNINWKTIQAFLKPDEAAVEIIRFRYFDKDFIDSVGYLFLIITDRTIEHPDYILLNNGKELESSCYNIYRLNLKSPEPDIESFNNFWSKIYDKLKGINKVYLSKDGIYNKINPSTFFTTKGIYLLEEQDIQLCNSTKDIITRYFKAQSETNLLNSAELFGNPDYRLAPKKQKKDVKKSRTVEADTSKTGLKKLPETETEIRNVEMFLKSKKWFVKTYLDKQALKSNVKAVSNPRVLHIATHGIFLPDMKKDSLSVLGFSKARLTENPLLKSGLFFAGSENNLTNDMNILSEKDNGILTAYEAMNLELSLTELVVLSACQTGLGEIRNGEGVYGLQRAFQIAGAKAILMSLWVVGDKSTSELMSKFYNYWVSGDTKRNAFRKAQIDIYHKYKLPYIWGAFVMVGE